MENLSSGVASLEKIDSALEVEWRELQARAASPTPFLTPEWNAALASAYGFPRLAIAWRAEGRLVGLLPIRRSSRTVRSAGPNVADILDPLSDPGFEPNLDQTLAQVKARALILPNCRRAGNVSQDPCLTLGLPETWETYMATLGKSLRTDLKRWQSGKSRPDDATLEAFTGPEALPAFEELVRLHSQRWRKKGLPGSFWGKTLRFHREWIATAPAGSVEIRLLAVAGRPAGALYTMHAGRTTFFYQSGFDPTAATFSPGTVLIGTAIRAAIERGDTAFDFLRGDEPYKRRWKPETEAPLAMGVVHDGSLIGRSVASRATATQNIAQKIKRRVEGTSRTGLGTSR